MESGALVQYPSRTTATPFDVCIFPLRPRRLRNAAPTIPHFSLRTLRCGTARDPPLLVFEFRGARVRFRTKITKIVGPPRGIRCVNFDETSVWVEGRSVGGRPPTPCHVTIKRNSSFQLFVRDSISSRFDGIVGEQRLEESSGRKRKRRRNLVDIMILYLSLRDEIYKTILFHSLSIKIATKKYVENIFLFSDGRKKKRRKE